MEELEITDLHQRIRDDHGRRQQQSSRSEQTASERATDEQSSTQRTSGEPSTENKSTESGPDNGNESVPGNAGTVRKSRRKFRSTVDDAPGDNSSTDTPSEDGLELLPSPIEIKERRKVKGSSLKNPFIGGQKETVKRVYKAFTAKEREERKSQLISAFVDLFELLDQAITATTKGHEDVVIWSDMDELEIAILIEPLLTSAMFSEKGAKRVMSIIESHQKLKVGLILAPRFYQTIVKYATLGFSVK